MIPQWLIEKKRDGEALSDEEIRFFVEGFNSGTVPDYQMSALAMAVYFQGMTPRETTTLTRVMMESGSVLDTSSIARPKADKHSTGGIGDKVSLILAPLAACCGVAVPMISGRGLGITGGTLDKLESIPGYNTALSETAFLAVVAKCGCSIMGQTADLAPADKKLYALRDVTGTVPSIPLIVASIMSKKLAEGLDALVLDVKCGTGAFMKTRADAERLAHALVSVGTEMGTSVAVLITDMNEPLGRCVGNALEVVEAVTVLRGEGAADLVQLTQTLCARMLCVTGVAASRPEAEQRVSAALTSGAALATFREMIQLHGGDPLVIDRPEHFPRAQIERVMPAPRGGTILTADAGRIGQACLILGAGRSRITDPVDHAVGITGLRKVGESVTRGEPLCTLHANDGTKLEQAVARLADAFVIGDHAPKREPLIREEFESRSDRK